MATVGEALDLLDQIRIRFELAYAEKGPNKEALKDYKEAVAAMGRAARLDGRRAIEEQLSLALDALNRAEARLA